jgi:hypothetical protein
MFSAALAFLGPGSILLVLGSKSKYPELLTSRLAPLWRNTTLAAGSRENYRHKRLGKKKNLKAVTFLGKLKGSFKEFEENSMHFMIHFGYFIQNA